jgi:hypothetical protein
MDTKMKALAVLLVTLVVGGALVMVQAQVEDASIPSTVPQQAKTLVRALVRNGVWEKRIGVLMHEEEELLGDKKNE